MKKIWAAIIFSAVFMAAGVHAWAGTFSDYWDFRQEDGTYAYAFPRIKISMDENWYRKTRVVLGDDGSTASFCHKASYNAYAQEGLTGGRLFTIGASVNTDFQKLPDFIYLGFDEEEAMNYYAELPTDYQAYTGDEKIRAEYDELWSEAVDVLDSVLIKGSEKYRELYETDETDPADVLPKTLSLPDYDYLVNEDNGTITIVRYTGDEEKVWIPAKIDGHPVAEIGAEAFRYRKFKSVSLPETICKIGRQAFEYCTISDNLILPENAGIMDDAFSYAVLPSAVTIPAGTMVEKCAFSYCEEVENVFIEPGVVIKSRGFGYCDDLKLVICADGSRLETDAFEYCRDLGKVIFCGDVETQEDAFNYCNDPLMTAAEESEYDTLKKSALDGSLTGDTDISPEDEGERVLEIRNSPAALSGVIVTLDTATAKRTETGGFEYTFSGSLENTSDEGIMQVVYTFALIDENGEEFRSFGEVYDGENTALAPHAKTGFFHDGIKWGKQSVPAAVEIGISSVKTEDELPPVHVPQKGEFLYLALGDEKLEKIKEEPPAELSFHVDQGGYGRTAVFGGGETLDKAVGLLCGIQIGEESGEWVTDNYNWIDLTWKDGSHTGISLNLRNLEHSIHSTIHTYELEHLDEFWSYAAAYLTEDE